MPVLLPAIIAAGSVGGGLAAAGGVTAAGIASGLAGTAAVAGIGKSLLSKPSGGGSVSQAGYDPQAEQKKAEDASRAQATVRQNEMTKTVLNPLGGSGAMQQSATQRKTLLGI